MSSYRIRRGKSLIEMLVVISLMSGALAICAITLSALFQTEVRLRRDREQQLAASRLADRWRADAHAAISCATDKECVFTLPDGRTAKYAIAGAAISREVVRGETTLHRDAFRLPKNAAAAFALSKVDDRDLAVLRVQAASGDRPRTTAVRPIVVEAVVNLHGAREEMP
jgi:type II secretory pathway pseudopilin PulG